MNATVWKLLNPAGVRDPNRRDSALRDDGIRHAVVTLGFLSNHKPNVDVIQREIGRRIAASTGVQIRFYEKLNPAVSAGPELLDRIAEECSVAINGIGD